jgi:hypothetical protein
LTVAAGAQIEGSLCQNWGKLDKLRRFAPAVAERLLVLHFVSPYAVLEKPFSSRRLGGSSGNAGFRPRADVPSAAKHFRRTYETDR